MYKKNLTSAVLTVLMACATTACTSNTSRPDTLAVQARESVRKAESVGADQNAPLALRDANKYLSEAESAMRDKDYQEAQRLLEKSMINSELAIARSNASGAKKAAEQLESSLETLEEEVTPNSQTGDYSYQ